MNAKQRRLKQLIEEGRYVVDPVLLASAILARAGTAQLSAEELRTHRGPRLGELLRARRLDAVREVLVSDRA